MGFFSSIKKGIKSIFKGVKKLFKQITSSTFGKILLVAAAIYVGYVAYAASSAVPATAAGELAATGTTTALEGTAAGSAAGTAGTASTIPGTVGTGGTAGTAIEAGAIATPATAGAVTPAATAVTPTAAIPVTTSVPTALGPAATAADVAATGLALPHQTLLSQIMGGLKSVGGFAKGNPLLTYGAMQGVSGMFGESQTDILREKDKLERERIERAYAGMENVDIRGVNPQPRIGALPPGGNVLQRYGGA